MSIETLIVPRNNYSSEYTLEALLQIYNQLIQTSNGQSKIVAERPHFNHAGINITAFVLVKFGRL